MTVYKLPCSWEMVGNMEVEAGTLKEAIAMAEDSKTPLPDGECVDCSFEVNTEVAEDEYKEDGREYNKTG